jgi:hypothetical protein
MIKTSLDWSRYETNLLHKANNLTHGKDVRKMIENIRIEVTKLSKAEVESRRSKNHLAEELLIKVNQDIEMVEEFLLVAALLG